MIQQKMQDQTRSAIHNFRWSLPNPTQRNHIYSKALVPLKSGSSNEIGERAEPGPTTAWRTSEEKLD